MESAEIGLPSMSGSPKQIAWAETIRLPTVKTLKKFCLESLVKDPVPTEKKIALNNRLNIEITNIADKTSATWWIENRNHFGSGHPWRASAGYVGLYIIDKLFRTPGEKWLIRHLYSERIKNQPKCVSHCVKSPYVVLGRRGKNIPKPLCSEIEIEFNKLIENAKERRGKETKDEKTNND
jgi:hypothetical protein